jgi:enoyl-CoA hydratase/carnithine racemase
MGTGQMGAFVKVERVGRVTVATLNRPERHNALTLALAEELEQAVKEFEGDGDQGVMILTGAGEKAFCSGADLFEMGQETAIGTMTPMTPEQDICGVAHCGKPVIAALNGLAVGGGFELALCCDFRFAAEHVWFGLPEVQRGFLAGIAAVTLPQLMPFGNVMELMLSGERLSAADAYRLGLVQAVLPADKLMAEAIRRAERMAGYSPAALWGTKQVLRMWRDQSLEERHRYYEAIVKRVLDVGDMEEGVAAFREKRKPSFKKTF